MENISETNLQAMMNKLQGGPNLINIEMRLSKIEDRFDKDLEVRLQNQTDVIAAKLEIFEGSRDELSQKIINVTTEATDLKAQVVTAVEKLDGLSMTVDMASAQSSALSDALAGSYQQYAMLNMQIAGLQTDVSDRMDEVENAVTMLNITIDAVGEEAKSMSASAQLFDSVFKLQERTLQLEMGADELKSRLQFTTESFDTSSTQIQEEISRIQQFQQTEGERQQNQWAQNKNFTSSVNQHIVIVQDTLNTLKTAAAVREEKITKAVNNGDKAAGQLKNIMKKIATYASFPGKIETVTREQNNLKAAQKQGLDKISLTIEELNSSFSTLENRLEAGENSIKSNAEKLINMNKIRSDIDLIKYTLNSASPSSVRAVANGKSVIPSDALDSLRNLIDNVNSDVNQLELSYNDVKNQVLAIGDDFSKLQIQSVAATSKLENSIENSKLQCDQDNAEQRQSISALKEHLNLIISDVSEFKDENHDSIELIEKSVTNVRNQVEDFTHSQKTLTSFVNNFKQDVEISIAGYLTHFTKYIETRSKGTQTTVRYIAASSDKFEQTADDQLLVPFNDVVSDAVGAATKNGGITASVDGKYQVTATVAGVKGTIVFVKVFDKDEQPKEAVRLYETAWNSASNSIVLDLNKGDTVTVAISGKGKLVDGKFNYLTVTLAEPSL
jgi:chromosome segregation ATPase